jgi:2-iminobutanoate/2-iminopropanoate deaminase
VLSGCSQESRVLTESSQRQILRNLSAVLEAGGSSLALVNKVNIFLVEPTDFAPMNEVYSAFFEGVKPVRVYPQTLLVSLPTLVSRMKRRDSGCVADSTDMHQARTCVFVKALPLGTDVEIECVARVGETAKL